MLASIVDNSRKVRNVGYQRGGNSAVTWFGVNSHTYFYSIYHILKRENIGYTICGCIVSLWQTWKFTSLCNPKFLSESLGKRKTLGLKSSQCTRERERERERESWTTRKSDTGR